jgi:Tol biopolymer transport system component
MKQCPKCSRVYADETLNFCLDDGEWLLPDSQNAEAPTALISGSGSAAAPTKQTLSAAGESTIVQTPRPSVETSARPYKTPVVIAVGILIIAGLVFGLNRFLASRSSSSVNAGLKVSPLTSSPGVERNVAFSPDGKQVAYVWTGDKGDNFDLYVKSIGAGEPLQRTNTRDFEMSPTWSPDGNYIGFLRGKGDDKGFYIIPALAGVERKVADAHGWGAPGALAQAVDWSPDGKTLAVVDKASDDDPWSIFLISIDSGERRKLTQPPPGYEGDRSIAFSPDGSRVAFVRRQAVGGDIYTVSVLGGEPVRLTTDEAIVFGLAWTPNGAEVVFSSDRTGEATLWRVPAAGGDPTSIPGIGENVTELSIARQGDRLAYAQVSRDLNIYRLELTMQTSGPHAAGAPTSFISSTRLELDPQFAPDGRHIAFVSNRSGTDEIWSCDTDGKNLTQLTNLGGSRAETPSWSPDSRFVAFTSYAGGNADIYLVSANGGNVRRLTNDPSRELMPSWSVDGHSIYLSSNRTGKNEIWKIPVDGDGSAIQLTHRGGLGALPSADGHIIFFLKGGDDHGLWQMSADGGEETRLFESNIDPKNYAVTQHGIYFLTRQLFQALYTLNYFDLTTRKTTQVTTLDGPSGTFQVSSLTVSSDEHSVLYGQRDKLDFDLMLVENFH